MSSPNQFDDCAPDSAASALGAAARWTPFLLWTAAAAAASWGCAFAYLWGCGLVGVEPKQQGFADWLGSMDLNVSGLAAVFLLGVVLVPPLEELLFLGVIYRSLRAKSGPWLAIPISAALFAVAHCSVSGLPPTFVTGCILACAFERTGSLRLPIAIHCTYNFVAIAVTLLTR